MKTLVQSGTYPILLLQLSRDSLTENIDFNYFDFSAAERPVIMGAFPTLKRLADQLNGVGNMMSSLRLDQRETGLLCCLTLLHGGEFIDG